MRKKGERLRLTVMPKKRDGTGVVAIQCSEGAFTELKLDNLPWPIGYGELIDGRHYIHGFPPAMGTDSVRYRVIWPDRTTGSGKKLRTSSFSLGPGHSNETLYVFAEFLRNQGVDFVCLGNANGTGFKPAGLSGSNLAYLSTKTVHTFTA